jgi:peptide deformylase
MLITDFVRQIGDHTLENVPVPVDFTTADWSEKASATADLMFTALNECGGVGIAANQVTAIENPSQMCIIGIKGEKNRKNAQLRYPNESIPYPTLMLNPKILSLSYETYFPQAETCLSVFGNVRARVKRHRSVELEYYDINGHKQTESHQGMAAHIIQHEMDHLSGLIYIHHVLDELTEDDLERFETLLSSQLKRVDPSYRFDINDPPQASFDRTLDEDVKVCWDVLTEKLGTLTGAALSGLLEATQQVLAAKNRPEMRL